MTQANFEHNYVIQDLLAKAYESRVHDLNLSINLAENALLQSKDIDSPSLIAKSLTHLSLFYMIRGQYDLSKQFANDAISYYEILNDEKGIADARFNISSIHYKTDNYHLGLVQLLDCLAIYRKYDDFHSQSKVEKSLGTIYEYFGDIANATKSYELGIESAQKAGDINLESNCYNPLSGIYLKQGNVDGALEIIERAIKMKSSSGDARGLAFAYYGRGKVYIEQKRYKEAEEDLLLSLELHYEKSERLGLSMTYNKLGTLYMRMGKNDRAKEVFHQGFEFSDKYNVVLFKSKCSFGLHQLYKIDGDYEKALFYLELYQTQKEAIINAQVQRVIDNYEVMTRMKEMEKEAELQKERAEIIEKKNRAEEAARIKQEFLSTMSHEIRTPLNAILTISSLLKNRNDQEEQKLLDSLKFSGNNLMRIVNDILDFTKLDSGKMQIENRPTELQSVMRNLHNTFESTAHSKGIDLHIDIDAKLHDQYLVDDTRLCQVIGNLVSNAIKFTEKGHVKVEVSHLSATSTADTIRFKVSDTGEGIAPKFLEDIFESFAQPRSVTTRKQGGTGLGLAIVKRIVELYDSRIFVESKIDHGSQFHFDLVLEKIETQAPITPEQFASLKGKRALLAEDNMINAIVATKLLTDWGLVVDHVEDGRKAIDKANEKTYDVILMDIHMPETNGYQATESIRTNDGPNKLTPIFALTADVTADHEEQYVGYFEGFLNKPIEIEKMQRALVSRLIA